MRSAIDRYIEAEPVDNFTPWCEAVYDQHNEALLEANLGWFEDQQGQYNDWLNNLYNKETEPVKAARIIERAFNLYKSWRCGSDEGKCDCREPMDCGYDMSSIID